MELEKSLKQEFAEVKRVYFEKEGALTFLRVEVSKKTLTDVADISRKISNFIDGLNIPYQEYYLDIFSPGTEEEIDKKDLKSSIDKNIKVLLIEKLKEKDSFEGVLISVFNDSLIIKWNAKGQFRKQEIKFENIKKINLSTKIKKEK